MNTTEKKPNTGMLAAVNGGIEKANRRAAGEFDGLFGSMPKNTAKALSDIVENLREYLLEERRLTEKEVRVLMAETVPESGFRSVSQRGDDEGIRVAVGIMNSLASIVRIKDSSQMPGGRRMPTLDAITLLLGGQDALARQRYLESQQASSKKGAKIRSEEREARDQRIREIVTPIRLRHGEWSDSAVAKEAAKTLVGKGFSASSIRQALPRLDLSKKPAE